MLMSQDEFAPYSDIGGVYCGVRQRSCRFLAPSFTRLKKSRKRLVQVPQQVLQRLDPDRQPYQPWADARRQQLVVRKLLMRRRRRMDDQRLHVAHIGEMREELQLLDEPLASLAAAFDLE